MKKHMDEAEDKKLIKEEITKAEKGEKLKCGGKMYKKGGKVKKEMKVDGGKAVARLDKMPRQYKTGGSVGLDTTDSGISPSNPLAKMKSGGEVEKKNGFKGL